MKSGLTNPLCTACGRPMSKEGDGWACQDKECVAHLYVVHPDPPMRYCVHGATPLGSVCPQCNPLRR